MDYRYPHGDLLLEKLLLTSTTLLVVRSSIMKPNPRRTLANHIHATSTQSQFAKRVRCSEPHLSLILSGEKDASIELAQRISAAVNNLISWKALLAPHTAKALRNVA